MNNISNKLIIPLNHCPEKQSKRILYDPQHVVTDFLTPLQRQQSILLLQSHKVICQYNKNPLYTIAVDSEEDAIKDSLFRTLTRMAIKSSAVYVFSQCPYSLFL